MSKLRVRRVREPGPEGKTVLPLRAVDTLQRLHKAGTITDAMLEAGRRFERAFAEAGLEPLRAASLERIAGGDRGDLGVGHARLQARRRLHRDFDALGGVGSPAGSCLWQVLGLGRSLRAWALGRGWRGRPMRQEQALGILVAALGVLAGRPPFGITGLDDDGQNR
jgi:hypothetical protein